MRKPKYRRHASRDRAFVECDGKRHYLPGRYKSSESLAAYQRFLRDRGYFQQERGPAIYVATLALRWLDWAEGVYPIGTRSEAMNCRCAVTHLLAVDERTAIADYSPLRLKALQQHLARAKKSRNYINAVCARVRRMFKWGVSEELVPAAIYLALSTVPGLRAGRSPAVETKPRRPVEWVSVNAVLGELSPTVAAMVLLQWHTGARSQSVCQARAEQFDRTKDPWEWRPRHKTESLGRSLVIYVGPQAQEVLTPFLENEPYLFQPLHLNGKRAKGYRAFYDSVSYLRAVSRACDRAGITRWTPHQLRHAKATRVRAAYGLEAAQATTGHASLSAAQIYAQRAAELAQKVARETG